ncbi:MAG: SMI1/KNR4 family protein [Bacteroidia bacterium]|nr:SMI1/KNR4 family protein [Bacteroidia bacterium]
MKELYIIGEPQPLDADDIRELEREAGMELPPDYAAFLRQYGYGNVNELLLIDPPDTDFVEANFGAHLEFWDLNAEQMLLVKDSLSIGSTVDGDILTIWRDPERSFVVLPRHSDHLLVYGNFQSLLAYYADRYAFTDDPYFDTSYLFEMEYISFVKDNELQKDRFDKAYAAFLEKIPYDHIFNPGKQPKYVLQRIGGWVYFDVIGKSAVRIKYQQPFREEAEKIMHFIRETA